MPFLFILSKNFCVFQRLSAWEQLSTFNSQFSTILRFSVILSKKLHAYEDMNRMTKCAEWQKIIWLIFIALALCLFCHSVKIKTPAGIKNKYVLSVHSVKKFLRLSAVSAREQLSTFNSQLSCGFLSFSQKNSTPMKI